MIKARGREKKLLRVISKLQDMIGKANRLHYNDRSRTSFEEAQKTLEDAFELCINTTGEYEMWSYAEENKK